MEEIQCIFCNKGSEHIAVEENGYKGRKCPNCGLIYISPRPSFSETRNLYNHNQARISARAHILRSFIKRLCAKHSLRIIEKFITGGSLLEIGAGAGYFLDEARKRGFEVYGSEFNSIQADFIRSKFRIPCEEFSLDVTSFGGKKFDIIYHCDVISHFYDPIADFNNISDRLKDKGILVFETGNGGDIRQKYYKLFATFQLPDHLFFFSEDNLKELLRRTEFELIKIYRYSILPQLLITGILRRAGNFIKSQKKSSDISKNNAAEVPSSNVSSIRQSIKKVCNYIYYLLRYKIGYVAPKKGRPQTVIVVARKRKRSAV